MGSLKFRRLWLVFAFLIATQTAPMAADAVVGVNIANGDRLTIAQQDEMLKAMKAAGVRVVRTGISGDDKSIDFARRTYALGMRIEWNFGLFAAYRPGAPTRPYQPEKFPGMWSGHPLSYADADLFRADFAPVFAKVEAAGIKLAALEFGNELKWRGSMRNSRFPERASSSALTTSRTIPKRSR